MIYSCFNQQLGLYEYFEDDLTQPFNGDLPVPRGGQMAGKVGVPASEAGRPLPAHARPTGKGWSARGIIVQCNNQKTKALSGFDLAGIPWWAYLGAGVLAYWAYQHSMRNWR